jgi:hypothetical protein
MSKRRWPRSRDAKLGEHQGTKRSWSSMKYRVKYKSGYGHIKICDRWLGPGGFKNFHDDMGDRPDGMTINRINNNGDYEPNNCEWATAKEQARNQSTNVWVTIGDKTLILDDWCKLTDVTRKSVWRRMNKMGMTIVEALTTPLKKTKPRTKRPWDPAEAKKIKAILK